MNVVPAIFFVFSKSIFTEKMNGSLLNATIPDPRVAPIVVSSWVYGIEGSVLIALNLPLAICILLNPSLRSQREFMIIAGSTSVDTIFGLAHVVCAIYRFLLLHWDAGERVRVERKRFCIFETGKMPINSVLFSITNDWF